MPLALLRDRGEGGLIPAVCDLARVPAAAFLPDGRIPDPRNSPGEILAVAGPVPAGRPRNRRACRWLRGCSFWPWLACGKGAA